MQCTETTVGGFTADNENNLKRNKNSFWYKNFYSLRKVIELHIKKFTNT
jgi:hypothetical protein